MSLKVVNAETDLGKVGRGGSNARFVLCDDGVEYIVKYMKNQGQRLFINELVGALSGNLMDCAVPEFSLVHFDQEFINASQDLKNQDIKGGVFPGVSRIKDAVDLCSNQSIPSDLANMHKLPYIVIFDNWVINKDRNNCGNLIISFSNGLKNYYQIDNGHILGGPQWSVDSLVRIGSGSEFQPLFASIADNIKEGSFVSKALVSLEAVDDNSIQDLVSGIPAEWADEAEVIKKQINIFLRQRRNMVRSIIMDNKSKFRYCEWGGL
ncbi:MAG: hypothetical protein M1166_05020 [Candidatus Thermoplasmatota archaeon]|nr:hypothetical protein [Candidatus Thermoplasmatota archaeon]